MRRVLTALLAVAVIAAPALASNDAYFPEQWGFQRIGAEFAWSQTRGAGAVIAVIDTGVDLNHPDLRTPSRFVSGRNFVDDNGDPSDVHGHGTLVTGAAAALSNNGIGVASVAPEVQIMPLRIFEDDGTATAEDAVEAIDYAVDNAARPLVLNLSFAFEPGEGGNGPPVNLPVDLLRDPEVDQAIERAAQSGAAVVIAAGNEDQPQTAYDADVEGVVVVGSTDRRDRRASFSNYGPGLDLVAPGVDIHSTYWQSRYATASGTSMSVPLVAGTAALLMSQGRTNVQALNRITATAEDLGAPGRDNQFGHGLLDVARALGVSRRTAPPPPPQTQQPTQAPIQPSAEEPSPLPIPSPTNAPPELTLEEEEPSPSPAPQAAPPTEDGNGALPYTALGLLILAAAGHAARRLYLI